MCFSRCFWRYRPLNLPEQLLFYSAAQVARGANAAQNLTPLGAFYAFDLQQLATDAGQLLGIAQIHDELDVQQASAALALHAADADFAFVEAIHDIAQQMGAFAPDNLQGHAIAAFARLAAFAPCHLDDALVVACQKRGKAGAVTAVDADPASARDIAADGIGWGRAAAFG